MNSSSSPDHPHPPPIAPAPAMHALTLPPSTIHPSLPSSTSTSGNSSPVPTGVLTLNDPKKKPPAKRKRTADSIDGDAATQPRTRDGPKKKKANRACFHCQKAHLTCDDCEYLLVMSAICIYARTSFPAMPPPREDRRVA